MVPRWWKNRKRDHFLPCKFIKRSSVSGATPIEQLLITGIGSQMHRKEKKISSEWGRAKDKDEKGDKGFWEWKLSRGEGVIKKEKFPHSRRPCHIEVSGNLRNHKRKHNRKFTTEIMLNGNYQLRSCLHVHVHPKQVGAGCGGVGCIFSPQGKDWVWMSWGWSEGPNVT